MGAGEYIGGFFYEDGPLMDGVTVEFGRLMKF